MRRTGVLLLLLLASCGWADLSSDVASAKSEAELTAALSKHRGEPLAQDALKDLNLRNYKDVQSDVVATLNAYDRFNGKEAPVSPTTDNSTAASEAKEIKKNPLYQDNAETQRESWISVLMKRIQDWLDSLWRTSEPSTPAAFPALPGLTTVIWALIILSVVALLVFAILSIKRTARIKRAGGSGLLEDDEPDLSADEWLTKADKLLAQKNYRAATRALYIATLMRFDEHAIARFDRSGTNWEHLQRIEASPKYPTTCEFRTATRLFDRVWYGYLDDNESSVQTMRSHYLRTRDALAGASR